VRLIYTGAASLAAPLLRLHLARRVRRGKEEAARLPERRGIDASPRPPGRLLWMHAASVGEVVSILPVLQALPGTLNVLLTTGTVTSASLLSRRLPELHLAGRVRHRYVPLDVPRWAARFLDHWRPDAACFVESEIWPNLLLACDARGISRVLVNARLSARSQAWWRRAPGFAHRLFAGFAWAAAQSEGDADRLRALGVSKVSADGNLKFAAPPLDVDSGELARLQALIGDRPVFLAASTRAGEEEAAWQAHRALAQSSPGLLTIIVPRHPERGEAIAALGGFPRRSLGQDPDGPVWIGDTLGEMGLYYRLARVVFVGGSLVPAGGQNPLEAARLGCAIAMGPHGFNNAGPIEALVAAGALHIVANAAELTGFVAARLADPAATAAMGAAAAATASRSAQLPAEIAARLAALLP
jgi:3-deoxy-D-manno-octulosonic-acid transferase